MEVNSISDGGGPVITVDLVQRFCFLAVLDCIYIILLYNTVQQRSVIVVGVPKIRKSVRNRAATDDCVPLAFIK